MNYKNTRRGFTLIELLVVVLIIGILAAVAVPQYQKAIYKSRFESLRVLTEALAKAEEIYYLANGKYTVDFEALDVQAPLPKGKSGNSSLYNYYYDWGTCDLQMHPTQSKVACRNNLINMTYQKYFKHSFNYANRKLCIAWDTTDLNHIRNKTCALYSKTHTNSDTYIAWWL